MNQKHILNTSQTVWFDSCLICSDCFQDFLFAYTLIEFRKNDIFMIISTKGRILLPNQTGSKQTKNLGNTIQRADRICLHQQAREFLPCSNRKSDAPDFGERCGPQIMQ